MSARTLGTSFLAYAPEAVRRLSWGFPADAEGAVLRAERELGAVRWHDDVEVAKWVVSDPFHGFVALALLTDDPPSLVGARIQAVMPELYGLAAPRTATTYEHEASPAGGRPTPLLDRVLRALRCALDLCHGTSPSLQSLVTATLLFSDVAKGGTPEQRAAWRTRLGIDGTVHNEDSAVIFEDVVRRVLGKAELSDDGKFVDRARVLCATSGLLGMRLRGEVGRDAFSGLVEFIAHDPDGGDDVSRAWTIVNHCETQAVRAELWSGELAEAFAAEERAILLAPTSTRYARQSLAERLARMRGGALLSRESATDVETALDRLRGARPVLESRLARCRIWYAEPALGALSLEASIRLLLHLSGAAIATAAIDTTRPWHLDLLGIVDRLRDSAGEPRRYVVRLLETILTATTTEELLAGKLGGGALVTFASTKGGEQALAVTLETGEEAGALMTLLGIYEKKTSADFHRTLKALCDLYGLRKDDFDRVHNESAYLATMNAARTDKARLLEFVRSGVIVEIGPGGGVMLDLLAERFTSSRIVGVDASLAVVEAHRARHAAQPAAYEMMHADASQLPELFPSGEINTVIFCSVLHEIFSYSETGSPPKRFRIEPVLATVGAAYRALSRGGRIVIRDGVAPVDEPRVIEFLDPAWRRGLDLFARSYEPRAIRFEERGPDRVRIGAQDLYEFLTTFTWGPASFPYEVREQRAVLTRADWVSKLLAACREAEPDTDPVEVPVGDLASYLQPGYPAAISPHVRIFDANGERELPMPDVNGVWVIEKM